MYVSSSLQKVHEILFEVPLVSRILPQLDAEQGLRLGSCPRIPVSFVGGIVYQSGISTFLVGFVVFLDVLELSIAVHVVREDQSTTLRRITEIGSTIRGESTGKFW